MLSVFAQANAVPQCKIGPAGADVVWGIGALAELIANNAIESRGAEARAHTLETNFVLRKLELDSLYFVFQFFCLETSYNRIIQYFFSKNPGTYAIM